MGGVKALKERYNDVHVWIMGGPHHQLQSWVDSGTVWSLEGAMGRQAMSLLRAGALVLPQEERHKDFWGNTIPALTDIADAVGSPGSVANAEHYMTNNEDR